MPSPSPSINSVLAHIIADPRTFHAARRAAGYRTFSIPKADGGSRTIHAPNETLKAAQREALAALEEAGLITYAESDHGFRPGHGVHTMLAATGPARVLVQADLARAFHQVTEDDVREWAERLGANSRTARWLSRGTCRPMDGLTGRRLVMGSPLAPAILLQVTRHLREQTERLARVYGGTATWYADNLVVEVPRRNAGRARRALANMLRNQRWEIKAAPEECPRVLGWTWKGVGNGDLFGWRSLRRMRKAGRGRMPRWEHAARRAEQQGNQVRADKLRARSQGTRAYLEGPARHRTCAPAYASAKL